MAVDLGVMRMDCGTVPKESLSYSIVAVKGRSCAVRYSLRFLVVRASAVAFPFVHPATVLLGVMLNTVVVSPAYVSMVCGWHTWHWSLCRCFCLVDYLLFLRCNMSSYECTPARGREPPFGCDKWCVLNHLPASRSRNLLVRRCFRRFDFYRCSLYLIDFDSYDGVM